MRLVFVFLLLAFVSRAQDKFLPILQTTEPVDTGCLFLHTDLLQFFRNTEYFNPIVEGYTYPGSFAGVGLSSNVNEHTTLYAGVESLVFWGDKRFSYVLPDFRIRYHKKRMTFLMGTLPASGLRGLTPVILSSESIFYEPKDRGVELAYSGKLIETNTWVAWQHFLHPGTVDQERFVIGQKAAFFFVKNKRFELSAPLQFTLHHIGGQVNAEFMPVKMIYNNATGLKVKYVDDAFQLGAEYLFCGHKVASSVTDVVYRNGSGNLVKAFVRKGSVYVGVDFWDSYQYYSPIGEPMYMSQSVRIPLDSDVLSLNKRRLLHPEFYFDKELAPGVKVLVGSELFYDLHSDHLDYNYTIALKYSGDFKLLHLKFRK